MSNHSLPDFDIEVDIDIDQAPTNNEDIHSSGSSLPDLHIPLPTRRKRWFFLSYSIFLVLYLVFVLVLAYTYPIKPACVIKHFKLPALDNKSPNITQQTNNSVYVAINFINRNPLISYSYDGLIDIAIDYYPLADPKPVSFVSTTTQGFYQHHRNRTKVEVHVVVPDLPRLLLKMKKESFSFFLVNLVFNVRFNCKVSCTRKEPLLMNPAIWYVYVVE
ncbi:hypothetical protein R6Q59_026327 [Mikania micrantha]|uniref:Late embryogenesis abundant protein LEA-2 subgroup domain-containing protein n=1 Tax=Mikania micrantha TaxID=192012 RepID=A0A5N6PDN8_9ASTR|nr:hypothetical protein E3N88_11562 [Mikania micrantha]